MRTDPIPAVQAATPASDPMNLVQLPGIHLTAPCTLVEGLDTHARLAPALEHMLRHVPDIAPCHHRDLTHWGERSAYDTRRFLPLTVKGPNCRNLTILVDFGDENFLVHGGTSFQQDLTL